jgi:hypothetical protein
MIMVVHGMDDSWVASSDSANIHISSFLTLQVHAVTFLFPSQTQRNPKMMSPCTKTSHKRPFGWARAATGLGTTLAPPCVVLYCAVVSHQVLVQRKKLRYYSVQYLPDFAVACVWSRLRVA